MKTHKDLDVWNKSMDLVEDVYRCTREYPQDERVLLVTQMRRAAISVPSNISEGASRNYTKEFIQFLYIALGSNAELETHVLLSERLGYISGGNGTSIKIVKIRQMLLGLIRSLKSKG